MLKLRSESAREATIFVLGHQGLSMPPSYGKVIRVGYPSIIVTDPNTTATVTEWDIPFGYLTQGKSCRGKLRDKDVVHVKGDGVIEVGRLISSSRREYPDSTGNYYLSPVYSIDGSGLYPIDHFFYWGEDAEVAHSYELPLGSSSGHGEVQHVDNAVVRSKIRFSGDYCLMTQVVDSFLVRYADEYEVTVPRAVLFQAVLKRVWGGDYYIPHRCNLSEWTAGRVIAPPYSETHYAWDQVPLDPAFWSGWLGPGISYTRYESLCSQNVEEYIGSLLPIRRRVEETLLPEFRRVREYSTAIMGNYDVGELAEDILAQHKVVDTSLVLLAYDLAALKLNTIPWKNFLGLVTSVWAAIKRGATSAKAALRAMQRILRNGSGSYLGVKYGVMPTLSDLDKVWDAGERLIELFNPSRLHSRRLVPETARIGSLESTYVLTVEVGNFPGDFLSSLTVAVRSLYERGLWPTLTTAWDFIPFTFVVDWFIPIGDWVKSLDDNIWIRYYPIQYVITSRKQQWYVSVQDLWPTLGLPQSHITLVWYERWIEDELPPIPPSVGDTTDPTNHWIEASALIFQSLFGRRR